MFHVERALIDLGRRPRRLGELSLAIAAVFGDAIFPLSKKSLAMFAQPDNLCQAFS